ncbi:DNA polymerase lambda isoform X2 [Colius striatus]|uniref:DNA polymerase lambda isoform X2 n=1 Tax=Colius striatus TaxID=57412 RepID=UPI002B1DEB42|nr:DNA polymerase lambda isoform X2 [Colius striatus]
MSSTKRPPSSFPVGMTPTSATGTYGPAPGSVSGSGKSPTTVPCTASGATGTTCWPAAPLTTAWCASGTSGRRAACRAFTCPHPRAAQCTASVSVPPTCTLPWHQPCTSWTSRCREGHRSCFWSPQLSRVETWLRESQGRRVTVAAKPPTRPMEPRGIVKAFPKRKKVREDPGNSIPPKIPKEEGMETPDEWLKPVTAYVLQAGVGQARAEIFHKQVVQNGGAVCHRLSSDVTHVIVAEDMDCERAFRLLKLTKLPSGLQLVKASWLSACIRDQKLLSTAGYRVFVPRRYLEEGELQKQQQVLGSEETQPPAEERAVKPNTEAQLGDSLQRGLGTPGEQQLAEKVSDGEDSEGEDASVTQGDLEALISGHYPVKSSEETSDSSSTVAQPASKWVCAQSSDSKKENHNQCITEKLEVLAKAYSVQGDKWRALGYNKAINALKSYHKPVTSYQEACKIPGIGKRMAEKILEILESGHLRKLDHISESVPVLELFSNIWGAGAKTAQMWYQQGFRTLDDIRSRAALSSQQAVGLRHYEDLLQRMPREEAAEIEHTVRQAALALKPGLVCVACGSYRRGKPTCGDVDVLVTHPDGQSHRGLFGKLLDSLRGSGFLTDDLVSQEDNGEQQKYLGVCRLPGPARRHRRLDIIVVPYSEFACALLYFTGSAHFNRSMRALAKSKGMSLSEHALSSAVVRGPGGAKVAPGRVVPTATERDVFLQLGLPYREPSQRDW